MVNTPLMQPFTELVKIIRAPKKIKRSDYTDHFDGAIPVVDQGGGLIGGYTDDTEALLQEPDPVVVFGDHTCRFKYVDFPFAAGADGTQIFKGVDGVSTRYLYYACSAVGVDLYGYQRHFKHLKASFIPVHEESVQLKITQILSTYDDLIENNTRRIEILEEMARRLYEEWFVYFRFPGHGDVSFKESELWEIPERWDVCRLEDTVAINPRTKVPKEGEKLFVPMGALSESSMIVGSLERKSGNSGAKFQNGDTLVARITPCLENGKTGFVDFLPEDQPSACGSTEFIVLRSISLCPEMVYLLARSDRFRDVAIKSMSGATGRQRVRVESLAEFPVVQPDNATLEAFQRFVSPCFKQARTLALKNSNLRAQRDLLLPKLVSGEIDVSDIPMPEDKEVEAA